MAPVWLTVVAWLYLTVCFCCAGIIAYDIALNQRRQPMGVMNVVFPVTALYFGPFALALYWRWGRAAAPTTMPPMPVSRALVSQATTASAAAACRRTAASMLITTWLAQPDQAALASRHRRASGTGHGGSPWRSR